MLKIYVPKLTNRIGYTLNVLFNSILREEIALTSDETAFEAHAGPKLCYGTRRIGESPWVKSVNFLFETSIVEQELHCFKHNGRCAFFPVYGKNLDFPFDLFAASFYLVSRYEEYLPHHRDIHGRFSHEESLAYEQDFLDIPLVEIWASELVQKIQEYYPDFRHCKNHLDVRITVDIDAAYSFRQKGVFRTITGSLRDTFIYRDLGEVRRRWRVLLKKEPDPFDTFDYIISQRELHPSVKLIFFALLGNYDLYDKNISHNSPLFQELLKHLGDYSKIGIHTSYASADHPEKVELEIDRLSQILHKKIVRNRFHFLRLNLPESYRTLIANGITHDYTMGYANTIGFRASISRTYPFFDLGSNAETTLTIVPFCMMDTALRRHMGLSVEEACQRSIELLNHCHEVGGTFCGIWHNENLCDDYGWEHWRTLLERMLEHYEELRRLPCSS